MKETAIIYCRKSTDREELQQNSIEHQLNNCKNTIDIRGLLCLDEIKENKSAKDEFKREGFNRVIEECKKGKVDYIVIDEPKRLSRNNIDSSRVIDLMDKKKIKGIYTTGREYLTEHPRDKFFLQFDLSLSKMDNEDRSKDIKDKMLTAVKKGKWMGKAIYGYTNIGTKGKKDVEVVENEAEIVRECFIMRTKKIPLQQIAWFINDRTGINWNPERVSKMIKNKKYYGVQCYGGIEEIINTEKYTPIISKELYDKANSFKIGYELKKNENLPRYFSGILKDEQGFNLYPYLKEKKSGKQYIYYHTGKEAQEYINIAQKKIFQKVEDYIKDYTFSEPFVAVSKIMLRNYYKDKVIRQEGDLRKINKQLNDIKEMQRNLFDEYLLKKITTGDYNLKKVELEERKVNFEERLKALEQGEKNVVKLIEDFCELVENLSETYKNGDNEKKAKIIRAMQCELFINKEKELTIKENKLFSIIKNFNIHHWYSYGELNPSSSLEKAVS